MFKKDMSKAPMRGDSYDRFKQYKEESIIKKPIFNFLFNWLVKGLLVAIIISIDFILFASSANYSFFAVQLAFFPHILFPIIAIFAISIGFMFLISFSYILENIFVAFVATISTFALINQFITISPESFLYSISYNVFPDSFASLFVTNSDVIVSLGVGVVALILLLTLTNRLIFYVFSLFLMIFIGIIVDEYINQKNKSEFITLFENEKQYNDVKGNNFVYIMMPNATSYRYLSNMQEDNLANEDLEQAKKTILGFYAQNNFKLYNGAYVEQDNMFMNISNQFNILSGKKDGEHILDSALVDGYMKFKNRNEKHIYLEENKLFDTFKNANYKINVYQSHGIELCHSNNEIIADKCVEKQNRPFNLQNMNISESEKTSLLLLQWIESTKLFKNLSFAYSFINVFTDANKVALVGIPYDNLNVVNSIKTLDVIIDDMIKGAGNSTYFTILDVPGDMYIYDEFCTIKPKSEWLSKENLPWIKIANTSGKKKAYSDQIKCTYGKLQEFLNKIKRLNLDENTVVVIQGISGIKDVKDKDFIFQFRSDKAVTLAIKDPKYKTFMVNDNICPASLFITEYLYNKKICEATNNLEVSDALKKAIDEDIFLHQINQENIKNSSDFFNEWYKVWTQKNISVNKETKYDALIDLEGKQEALRKRQEAIALEEAKALAEKEAKELAISPEYEVINSIDVEEAVEKQNSDVLQTIEDENIKSLSKLENEEEVLSEAPEDFKQPAEEVMVEDNIIIDNQEEILLETPEDFEQPAEEVMVEDNSIIDNQEEFLSINIDDII